MLNTLLCLHFYLNRFSFAGMGNKKVTLSSIAEELKVSKSLISLVLNGRGDQMSINKATQEKVIKKAQELNYRPNQVARGLRMGQTKTIGLLVADISNPFFARITRTVEYFAEMEGYSLIVCSSDEDKEKELRLLRMLFNRQVDGIIMSSTLNDSKLLKEFMPSSFPLVLIDRTLSGCKGNFVGVDNENAVFKAVKELFARGHKHIGFLTITPDYISTLKDRRRGYLKAVQEIKGKITDSHILQLDYKQVKEKNYLMIREYLSKNPEITAIFTSNNSLAVGCLEAIKSLNLSIPKDISLITFDDVELFKYTSPPLTSIAQPLAEIGKSAVSILLENIKNGAFSPKTEILQTQLIIRESINA